MWGCKGKGAVKGVGSYGVQEVLGSRDMDVWGIETSRNLMMNFLNAHGILIKTTQNSVRCMQGITDVGSRVCKSMGDQGV